MCFKEFLSSRNIAVVVCLFCSRLILLILYLMVWLTSASIRPCLARICNSLGTASLPYTWISTKTHSFFCIWINLQFDPFHIHGCHYFSDRFKMINETRGPPFSDCVPMSDAESPVHLHIFVFVFNALKTIVILILILLFHKCNWLNSHDHWSLTSGRRVKLTHLWSLCCCVIIVSDHLPVV